MKRNSNYVSIHVCLAIQITMYISGTLHVNQSHMYSYMYVQNGMQINFIICNFCAKFNGSILGISHCILYLKMIVNTHVVYTYTVLMIRIKNC